MMSLPTILHVFYLIILFLSISDGKSFSIGETVNVQTDNGELLVGNSFVHDLNEDVFYIAGLVLDSPTTSTSRGCLTKIYKNGTRQWTRMFGTTGVNLNSVSKVLLDPASSDVFVVGSVYSYDLSADQVQLGGKDGFVARFAANGTQIYARLLGSEGYDSANDVSLSRNGQNLVIAGSFNSTHAFYFVAKDNGTLLNVKSFPGYYGELRSMVIASDSRAFVTGSVGVAGYFRVFMARISPDTFEYVWQFYLMSYAGSGYSVRYSAAADEMFITGMSSGGYGLIASVSGAGNIQLIEWFYVPIWDLNILEGGVLGNKLLASADFQQTVIEMDFDTNILDVFIDISVQNWLQYLDIAESRGSGYGLGRYPATLVKVNLDLPASTATLTIAPTPTSSTGVNSNLTIISNNGTLTGTNITGNTPMTPTETLLVPKITTTSGTSLDPASAQNILMFAGLAGMAFIALVISIMIYLHRRWVLRAKVHDEADTRRISRTYETENENDDFQMTTLATTVSSSQRRYVNGVDFITGHMMVLGRRHRVGKAIHDELKIHGESIVIKSFVGHDPQEIQPLFKQYQHELSILQLLDGSSFTVKLLGFSGSPNPNLLFKYYTTGNLRNFIENHHLVKSKRFIMKIISDVARGLNALHAKEIVHGALTLEAILLDMDESGDLCCVISNFSFARQKSQQFPPETASLTLMSPPELLARRFMGNNSKYDFEIMKRGDVYTFSHLLFSILIRKTI